ncbi:kynureninase [Arcticibacterium luteifluviistationis]|uniref:Kynureninase n=1 Tax=Arcticibacterium luteifluviistationis TaxID=1784714 RepID=A0A2Z4GBT7_9BACT|nr:kynureninase [Arcticibacterium luteifluviistationis]AWV98752.1 kynureninase [Arcticibacterium luteifluviistationis]
MTDIRAQITQLDQEDPLKAFRNEFVLDLKTIYLDGNSLGVLPKKTKQVLEDTINNQWGARLIRSWNEDWLSCKERIASKVAKLINAEPNEVIIADSVSVNLYKLAFASLTYQTNKSEVLTDNLNFPSDLYIFQELCKQSFPDKTLNVVHQDKFEDANANILNAITEDTSLVSLSHVTFQNAFRYDVKNINEKAREMNALNLWDLSHSVGAVPIDVKALKIDMAVGCTYKYLNGGPGAPAFLYVSKELQNKLQNPIAGWFSHAAPFDFSPTFEGAESIHNFAVGTPPVLSMKAIEPGIDIFLNAGVHNIQNKSELLFELFLQLFQLFLKEREYTISTPLSPEERGSHIALTHEEAYRINLSLINPRINRKTIITDHRPPDIIRIALTPLYLSFSELCEAVIRLVEIVDTKEFENHSPLKSGVI